MGLYLCVLCGVELPVEACDWIEFGAAARFRFAAVPLSRPLASDSTANQRCETILGRPTETWFGCVRSSVFRVLEPRIVSTRHRLRSTIIGLPDGQRHAVEIPSGAVVLVPSHCPTVGIVTVWHDERPIRVFVTDLNRSEESAG